LRFVEPAVTNILYDIKSVDEFVYHYTASTTLVQYIAPSGKVRFSRFCNTNDPRETKSWDFAFGTTGSFDGVPIQKTKALASQISDIFKVRTRLFCVTMDDPEGIGLGIDRIWHRGFCRPRMWSHYAENHKGACLIFNKQALDKRIRLSIARDTEVHNGPITYKNRSQAPSLVNYPFMLNFDEISSVGVEAAAVLHLRRYRDEIFLEKATDWNVEREYRWLTQVPDDGDLFVSYEGALVGIVLGPDFPPEKKAQLMRMPIARKVTIAELRWKCGGVPEVVPIFEGWDYHVDPGSSRLWSKVAGWFRARF
jgi:hypothetical protein